MSEILPVEPVPNECIHCPHCGSPSMDFYDDRGQIIICQCLDCEGLCWYRSMAPQNLGLVERLRRWLGH